MNSPSSLIVSKAELKRRTNYYLLKVENEGITLLIERDGIIAAQITPPVLDHVELLAKSE